MIRKKVTELLLAAGIALSAGALLSTGGPSSSIAANSDAQGVTFTAPRETALEGEAAGSSVFGAAGIERECVKTTYAGSIMGPRTLELEPVYDHCMAKAFSGIPVKVVRSGCTFVVHVGVRTDGAESWPATVDVSCPTDYTLEWHDYETERDHEKGLPLCTIGLLTQPSLGAAELNNQEGSPDKMEIRFELRGIEYKAYGSELFCGSAFGVLKHSGGYEGIAIVEASSRPGKPVDLALRD